MTDVFSNVVISATVYINDRKFTARRAVSPDVWAQPDLKEFAKQELRHQLGEVIVQVLDPEITVTEEDQ